MKKQILRETFSLMALFGLLSMPASAHQPINGGSAGDEIQTSANTVSFNGDGGTKTVSVKGSNYELFSASDWMTCRTIKGGVLEITTKPYDFFFPRTASIILTSKKTNYSKVIEVTQKDNRQHPEVMARPQGGNLLFLTDMDLSKSKPYYIKDIKKNLSVDDFPIRMKASRYEDGIATHAPTALIFRINGATRFQADVAIDDEIIIRETAKTYGRANYEVYLDDKEILKGALNAEDPEPARFDINLQGAKYLIIRFLPGETTDGDHIDLGNGRFEYSGEKPVVVTEEEMKSEQNSANVAPTPCPDEVMSKQACPGCKKECPKAKTLKKRVAKKGHRVH